MLNCLYFLGDDHAARDDSSRFACAVDEFATTQHSTSSTFRTTIHSNSAPTPTNGTHCPATNATIFFPQAPSFHTVNSPQYNTTMPGLQPFPQYNIATQGFQASPSQWGSSFTYQPASYPTSTPAAQPLLTTPASHQYPTTDVPIPPPSHPKRSRTRSRTTRKHRSTSRHRRRRTSTKQHYKRYTSQHRSTTPHHKRHTSQHRSRRRQHHSPTSRSRSNHPTRMD